MTIKDYAKTVLAMNSNEKTQQAIGKLKWAVKHEPKWNDQHRLEVGKLIAFLESGETDIEKLENFSI